MFERRLKIFLSLLVAVTAVLVLRAAFVQVVQKEQWQNKATEINKRSRPIETTRGKIYDFKKAVIAEDQPCMDACVDFRALSKDEKWLRNFAVERLRAQLGEGYKELSGSKRKELVAAEVERVRSDIDGMWQRLSDVSKVPLEEIEQTRNDVLRKVDIRRKTVWFRNYQIAMKKHQQREPAPAWRRWLLDDAADAPTIKKFEITIEEETDNHPIIAAVSTEVQIELRKHIEQYPGLVLQPGVKRHYPYGDAACHVIGNLARVNGDDLKDDPNIGKDELRQYYPNDLIGRRGLEQLGEQVLRGARGKVETIEGREGEVGRIEHAPGKDLYTTIDVELCYDIANMFRYAKVPAPDPKLKLEPEKIAMHGAAVVIDVPSGAVRALVSYPTFDLNEFNIKYAENDADELNKPLFNRATQAQLVPGSTVKPIVGLGAITDGWIGVNQGIECTGYLTMDRQRFTKGFRCWTASKFALQYPDAVAHHQIPWSDPHVGHHGNPNGSLTFADAIQRSCNVYFETLGDRLKIEGLSTWYYRFGLGRKTGIGIREEVGRLPITYVSPFNRPQIAWHSAIGQVQVTATPLQMANVAATIARGGVWMRPKLLRDEQGIPEDAYSGPDREDLHLNPDALAAAREGMIRVVNTTAGTGAALKRADMVVAGKTGTATASPLKVRVRDSNGEIVRDAQGKAVTMFPRPSTRDDPNPDAMWYRAGIDGDLNHAWYIGFAPADNPRIAFAVMIEYGVSGGSAAGSVASELLEACVERGYLPRKPKPVTPETVSSR